MASLKYNGEEKLRLSFRSSDNGMTVTDILSFGSRGWILRRRDVDFHDGHRTRGAWRRLIRWNDMPLDEAAAAMMRRYQRWEHV